MGKTDWTKYMDEARALLLALGFTQYGNPIEPDFDSIVPLAIAMHNAEKEAVRDAHREMIDGALYGFKNAREVQPFDCEEAVFRVFITKSCGLVPNRHHPDFIAVVECLRDYVKSLGYEVKE